MHPGMAAYSVIESIYRHSKGPGCGGDFVPGLDPMRVGALGNGRVRKCFDRSIENGHGRAASLGLGLASIHGSDGLAMAEFKFRTVPVTSKRQVRHLSGWNPPSRDPRVHALGMAAFH